MTEDAGDGEDATSNPPVEIVCDAKQSAKDEQYACTQQCVGRCDNKRVVGVVGNDGDERVECKDQEKERGGHDELCADAGEQCLRNDIGASGDEGEEQHVNQEDCGDGMRRDTADGVSYVVHRRFAVHFLRYVDDSARNLW